MWLYMVPDGTGEEGDASPQDESSANSKWNTWDRNNKTLEGSYLSDFRQAATDAGITIYQSSEDKDGWLGLLLLLLLLESPQ